MQREAEMKLQEQERNKQQLIKELFDVEKLVESKQNAIRLNHIKIRQVKYRAKKEGEQYTADY